MPVSLAKNGTVSLSKEAPGLKSIMIGLGWDVRQTSGAEFDLDASLFMLAANGKARRDSDFIFYNNLRSLDGSVVHTGDNRTGAGEGDDEVIKVDLTKVPADVTRLVVVVSLHEAEARGQNFGMVSNAFIRVVNQNGNKEIARYDLSEGAGMDSAMIFGEVYRDGQNWSFRALGESIHGGLRSVIRDFGLNA
jgi:tellurium resistance protein TerD